MNYSITILAVIFFLSCLGNQACALVEVNSPTGGIPINITEADISEAMDFTAEADFCLYSDVTDPIDGDGLFCIKWENNTASGGLENFDNPSFSLPYTVGVAIGPGQIGGFTPLNEGTYTGNPPKSLGTVPPDPCSSVNIPTMTAQITIPGNSLAAARAGLYGGANVFTFTIKEPPCP